MKHAIHCGANQLLVRAISAGAIMLGLGCGLSDRPALSSTRRATTITITELRVDGPDVLNVGESAQYTATAVFSEGTEVDLTNGSVWLTSDSTIATIGNFELSGIGTGVSPGEVVFTALFEDAPRGTKTVNVQ